MVVFMVDVKLAVGESVEVGTVVVTMEVSLYENVLDVADVVDVAFVVIVAETVDVEGEEEVLEVVIVALS